ncbi:Methyl-accepting chemotaxis protein [Noviherbaspirillum humi]|uniref:Methyl-accepting chemotaxis protein n=1 Tax=Noviherbaspirillum humi TaxID=1688639 RepID=A0A239KED5_9BURK|nr:methyl-accepting chemotaxis protein [Noviherbaspirillum humi]SNT16521.1 Methyl-accepting chemotaxis protein [Noviherbaspirillum humi]
MQTFLDRLLFWQKFALLSLLAILLGTIPLGLYVAESLNRVRELTHESAGLQPVRQTLRALALTQQHRGLSNILLTDGDTGPARQAKQLEADQAYADVAALLRGKEERALGDRWQHIQSRWQALATQAGAMSLPAPDSFARHTALVQELLDFDDRLLEHYHLRFDSEADSHYLIEAALMRSPRLMEALARTRGRGAGLLTRHAASVEDRIDIGAMLARVQEGYAGVEGALRAALARRPDLEPALGPVLQQSLDAGKQVVALAQKEILGADQLVFPAARFFSLYTGAIDLQLKLQDSAIERLDSLHKARAGALLRSRIALLALFLGLSAVCAWMALAIMRSVTVPMGKAVGVARRIAEGDLTARIEVRSADEVGQLFGSLQHMTLSLRDIVRRVQAGSDEIALATARIASGNSDLANRTEKQAGALGQTAASMEQIASAVMQNADDVRRASELAARASDAAARGGSAVADMSATMGLISESAQRIGEIIGVIDGIAFQTNMLALNAAVEAARAGEQGRGFAVVAAEVRTLAQRSAAAAREIKGLIHASANRTANGARQVESASRAMDSIIAGVSQLADIIGRIATANREQTAGVAQVHQAARDMDRTTRENANLVEEAAAAALALREQTRELAHAMGVFRLEPVKGERPPHEATD